MTESRSDATNAAVTTTENGASGGGTSSRASIAIAVVENQTLARIGSGAGGTISLNGDLRAQATHADSVITTASGEAAGEDVAVGASVALNIVVDDTRAEIGRSFSGTHDVQVAATSAVVSEAKAKASAKGASSDDNGDEAGGNASNDSEEETNAQSNYATGRSGTSSKPASDAQSGSIDTANSKASGELHFTH